MGGQVSFFLLKILKKQFNDDFSVKEASCCECVDVKFSLWMHQLWADIKLSNNSFTSGWFQSIFLLLVVSAVTNNWPILQSLSSWMRFWMSANLKFMQHGGFICGNAGVSSQVHTGWCISASTFWHLITRKCYMLIFDWL